MTEEVFSSEGTPLLLGDFYGHVEGSGRGDKGRKQFLFLFSLFPPAINSRFRTVSDKGNPTV